MILYTLVPALCLPKNVNTKGDHRYYLKYLRGLPPLHEAAARPALKPWLGSNLTIREQSPMRWMRTEGCSHDDRQFLRRVFVLIPNTGTAHVLQTEV
jgi:hypothetical protein